jgi:hypothetical protein
MSRAYRIRVRESMTRTVTAKDHVTAQLEVLEILPPEEMTSLLGQELEKRGFQRRGPALVRPGKDVTITVDPAAGTITAQAEAGRQVELETAQEGRAYDDAGPGARRVKKALHEQARRNLEEQARRQAAELQRKVTEELEGRLADLRQELDQVVNRVTAEALKRKAAQLGQIKELTEDPQSGSLTIIVEV